MMFLILPSPGSLETAWAGERRTREGREPSHVSPSEEAGVTMLGDREEQNLRVLLWEIK